MGDAAVSAAKIRRAEGPWSDLALYSVGWKAFQDLCSQVSEEVLHRPVEVFREAQDGGQDAVFIARRAAGDSTIFGTIQCKHSTDPAKRLRVGDLTKELRNVRDLVKSGQADTYVLMTSMSVDAPVAVGLRRKLLKLGVRKPHILGRQYLIRAIRSSARLRALVPQVYGLGDLGAILDARLIQQTRALLDHWIPKLRVYVPTTAHRKAVSALSEHGIVLLLGNPSVGKSIIGAILSTIASEELDHTVFNLTSPRDFEATWNPNEPKRFYWIDDAFGSNVLRDEYVQDWTSIFRKVQAAVSSGNRFVLTSRRHIYEAAKHRLGQRNLAVFTDGRAIVDVGDLSIEEKRQILYNHIKFGAQTNSWKRSVKPHLEAVARVEGFLPGIAERLGDPSFTKSLSPQEAELVRFMQEPREHLIDTINAMGEPQRAALILVYVHQGALTEGLEDRAAATAVSELAGVPLPQIEACFAELLGSFLKSANVAGRRVWGFAHPTIADALTDILKARAHMMAALLRGATVETIVRHFVCEGTEVVPDALIVPTTLDDVLIARLGQALEGPYLSWLLVRFLAEKANDHVFKRVVEATPNVLERGGFATYRMVDEPTARAHARAQRHGLLSESLREQTAARLENAAIDDFDLSFLADEHMLSLIPPQRLVALGVRLRTETLTAASEQIEELAEDADTDDDSDSVFDRFSSGLDMLEELPDIDDTTRDLIRKVRRAVDDGVERFEERKREAEKPDHSKEWEYMASTSRPPKESDAAMSAPTKRSTFVDVDA